MYRKNNNSQSRGQAGVQYLHRYGRAYTCITITPYIAPKHFEFKNSCIGMHYHVLAYACITCIGMYYHVLAYKCMTITPCNAKKPRIQEFMYWHVLTYTYIIITTYIRLKNPEFIHSFYILSNILKDYMPQLSIKLRKDLLCLCFAHHPYPHSLSRVVVFLPLSSSR